MHRAAWDESKKYRGHWWSHDEPDYVFPGVLRFDGGRPRLTFSSPPTGQEFYALADPQVIFGELDSGEKVTLWDLHGNPLHHPLTTQKRIKSRRKFTYAILGEHLNSHLAQEFRFSSYRLRGLLEFSERLTGVPSSLPQSERPKYADARFSIENDGITYEVSARVENPRQLEISDSGSSQFFPYLAGEDVRMTFECTPSAPAAVHDMLLLDFKRLLSFAIVEIIPVEKEWLAVADRAEMLPVMRRDSVHDVRNYAVGNLFSFNMLVTLQDVEPAILFPRWWKAVRDLYPATEVISSYNQGTRGVLESSTSSAIAIAERLQEAIDPHATRYSKGVYREMQAKIKEKFKDDPDFSAVLKSALGNRLALREKLNVVSQAVTPERFRLMSIDSSVWVQDVRTVRDLLAHTGSHVRGRSSGSAVQLTRVNQETRAIISLLVLKLMGLEDEVLDKAAKVTGQRLQRFRGQ